MKLQQFTRFVFKIISVKFRLCIPRFFFAIVKYSYEGSVNLLSTFVSYDASRASIRPTEESHTPFSFRTIRT